jgi:hypothetical protein
MVVPNSMYIDLIQIELPDDEENNDLFPAFIHCH